MIRRFCAALFVVAAVLLTARADGDTKDPAPVKLSGTGEQATGRFRLQGGLSTWHFTHDGKSNFQVTLLKSDGKRSDMTLNEIGRYNGTQAVRVPQAGEYLLNVHADGKWSVTIAQPQPTNPSALPMALSGKGPSVSPFVNLPRGISTFKMSHKGDSTFRVKIIDREGKVVEQVAASVGPYNGSKAVTIEEEGTYLINVSTKGEWSLKVE